MHSAYPYKRQVQSATAKIGIICHISFTLSKKVTNNAILNFMRNYRAVLRPRSMKHWDGYMFHALSRLNSNR